MGNESGKLGGPFAFLLIVILIVEADYLLQCFNITLTADGPHPMESGFVYATPFNKIHKIQLSCLYVHLFW